MKKRLYRALISFTMITVMLFCASACGGTTETTNEETFPEIEEESEESEETESEEAESEVDTEEDTKVVDGEYTIYPAFIKTFEINDNVLKVETGDAFEDYEIPTEMAINFEYPLANDVAWIDNVTKVTEEDDWYGWFSFSLEGITKAAERYNDGQYEGVYTSGEDFCKKNAIWTIIIENEEVQSISMGLVKDEVATATETKVEEAESVAPSAKEDTTVSAPTSTPTPPPTPAHTHNYSGSVTTAATCCSQGTMTYTCSCGSSYTESIAANGNHNWKEIYGTVEHASQGEMRQVQVGTSGEVYTCCYCGAEFSSHSAITNHWLSFDDLDHAGSNYLIRDGQPIYEEQWIELSPAWSESVVTGYQCSTCGATK